MTSKQDNPASNKLVVMVLYPDAHILDVVGPIEILQGTRLFDEHRGDPYTVKLVASQRGDVDTTSGLTLKADHDFASARKATANIDTLIVAGGHGTTAALEDAELLGYVSWAAARARRVVSICTGAMILARLGILDGRRATTHWWWCPILAREYPKVKLEPDALYIRDGHVWTSAGVTSGMDLSLALVEEDLGYEVAIQIARYNVMFMMRPGGQSQFSTQLLAQHAEAEGAITKALTFIHENINSSLTVTVLAARACMSERTFTRKFKAATSKTPAQYVELARLQAARVMLEQSDETIDAVSRQAGFVNAERMRRVFQRHLGVAAGDYRERFQRRLPADKKTSDSPEGSP